MKKIKNLSAIFLVIALILTIFSGCALDKKDFQLKPISETISDVLTRNDAEEIGTESARTDQYAFVLSDIPEYSGEAYVYVNDNVAAFTKEEIKSTSFEYYSDLDNFGRCGMCMACVGQDIMPKESRGEIGMIKPTGWHTVKYDVIPDKYLYNRCHLIGYQLSGENANEKNLITGTRYLNVVGMLPFENAVADYVQKTGNHVMYRVIPIFKGEELLARGVTIEAYSVEDNGAGINFYVFCYNVQPYIKIDYATGESEVEEAGTVQGETMNYILNTNSKKFHLPDCASVTDISSKNKKEYSGTREALISQGYQPCKACNP